MQIKYHSLRTKIQVDAKYFDLYARFCGANLLNSTMVRPTNCYGHIIHKYEFEDVAGIWDFYKVSVKCPITGKLSLHVYSQCDLKFYERTLEYKGKPHVPKIENNPRARVFNMCGFLPMRRERTRGYKAIKYIMGKYFIASDYSVYLRNEIEFDDSPNSIKDWFDDLI